jgi:type I restriction enzyme S subunit
MSEWKDCLFHEAVMFPPKITLEKGKEYSFIPMEDINGTTKYVTPKNVKKWIGTGGAKFEEGDTLFARITPCLQNGKIAQAKNLLNGKGFGSTEYFIFRGKENISDTDFVYYLSQTEDFRKYAIGSMVGASGRQRADATFVGNYPILLPSLPTQQRIASILSAYDDLIENNLKRIKLLEEIAQRTYEEWFVKFRINGVQLELGENGLPEGWEERTLKETCLRIQSGGTPSRANKTFWDKGNFNWFKTKELRDSWLIDSEEKISTSALKKSNCFPSKTILMAIYASPTLGRLGILEKEASCNQAAVGFICNENIVSWQWLYFKLFELRDRFNGIARGAGQQNISADLVKNQTFILPNINVIAEFTVMASTLFEKILNLQNQNRLLKESRDILLPRLMSGKLGV